MSYKKLRKYAIQVMFHFVVKLGNYDHSIHLGVTRCGSNVFLSVNDIIF